MRQSARYAAAISLIAAILSLFGCGSIAPLQTEEQELARLELRTQFATSVYRINSQEEIFRAAELVLRELDDDGDFLFRRTENRLLVSRDWRWFGILIGKYFRHYFEFMTQPAGTGLELTISGIYRHKHGNFGWSKPNWENVIRDIPYSGSWGSASSTYMTADDFRLLHNQIRFKLGLWEHQFGCREARADKLEKELYWTPLVCYDGHGWNDD
jgi:hypothetical protein